MDIRETQSAEDGIEHAAGGVETVSGTVAEKAHAGAVAAAAIGAVAATSLAASALAPRKAQADDATYSDGNITVSVPTRIGVFSDLNGNITVSSPEAARIENLSDREVRVSALTAEDSENWHFVSDAETSEQANSVELRLGPAADMEDLSQHKNGEEVSDKLAWTMAQSKYGSSLDTLQLDASGAVANVDRNELAGQRPEIGTVTWHFEDDTVTNQIFDQIDAVDGTQNGIAEGIEEIVADAGVQQSELNGISEDTAITAKPVSSTAPDAQASSGLWVDTAEKVVKYYDGSNWVPIRSVWG